MSHAPRQRQNADEAIQSLMAQMGQAQGYVAEEQNDQTAGMPSISQNSSGTSNKIPRQLLELEDYPNSKRAAGSHSIWNPYVQSDIQESDSVQPTTSIPTNPMVEVIRRRAFESFKQQATEILKRYQEQQRKFLKSPLPIPSMLEKWHMDAKLMENSQNSNKSGISSQETPTTLIALTADIYKTIRSIQLSEGHWRDPILLSKQASKHFRSAVLEPEVRKAFKSASSSSQYPKKFAKHASNIQKGLHRCICEALETFEKQLQHAVQQEEIRNNNPNNRKKRKLPKLSIPENNDDGDKVQITFAGISLQLHAVYFEKLQRLYDRAVLRRASTTSGTPPLFIEVLFCVLCRYDMLQGAGLQAGVPGRVMDVLLEHNFQCQLECFASPLNCRYERFGSAFDLDRAFGSLGSIFDVLQQESSFFTAQGGCYQANPPFCETVIEAFNASMIRALEKAAASEKSIPLMFVVFVPVWKESTAYQEGLLKNPFMTHHLTLKQGKHWYTEGTQHRRKGSFRVASFDTSILFYQNPAAKRKWPIDQNLLDRLQVAFTDDPGVMERAPVAVPKCRTKVKPLAPPNEDGEQSEQMRVKEVNRNSSGHHDVKSSPIPSGKLERRKEKRKMRNSQTSKASKKSRTGPPKSQQEEAMAQLQLLQSLGLAADTTTPEATKMNSSTKKSKPSKSKKSK